MNHPLRKLSGQLLAVALLLPTAHGQAPAPGDYREFTGSNGVVIKAVLIDKSDTDAALLMSDGRRVTVPLDKLSPADQAYVKSWSKEKAVFLQKCRSLTIRQCLELRGYESFPFKLENNSIHIEGKIHDKPARLLVDTGAGTSLLHIPFAEAAGLTVGPLDEIIRGVSGEAPAGWTPVPALQLGEAVFKDRRILATDMNKDRPDNQKLNYDAILGADILRTLDAVISYPERRIFLRPDRSDQDQAGLTDGNGTTDFRLFKTKEGRTLRGKVISKTPTVATLQLVDGATRQVPITNFAAEDESYLTAWTEEGALFLQHCHGLTIEDLLTLRKYQSFHFERRGNHIFVDGTLNGHEVTYMIDTGADLSLLHIGDAKKYGCEVGDMNQEVWGIGGKAPAAVAVIAKLTMGEATLTNRKLLATDLARGQPTDQLGFVGLFGADFMRELDAVITYTEDRIFLIQR
jgi:predicted aspartyl protease